MSEAAVTPPIEPAAPPVPPVVAETPPAAPAAPAPVVETPPAGLIRPEGLPDSLWDATTGLKTGDLVSQWRDLTTKAAEAAAAKGEVPADAAGYDLSLPEGFQVPEGFKVEIDKENPFYKAATEHAHKEGWSQAQMKGLVALEAQRQIAEQTGAVETYKAEMLKLGANGKARIDAATNYLKANLTAERAGALAAGLYNAAAVEALEALIGLKSGPSVPSTPGGNVTQLNDLHGEDLLRAVRAQPKRAA